MANKTIKSRTSPWGDDHPEKLNDTAQPFGFAKQLKSLISPTKMLDQIFNTDTSYENKRQITKEKPEIEKRRSENLIFSYKETKQDVDLTREIKAIHEQLVKSVAQLEKAEKGLTSEVAKIKVEQLPKTTGIYYLRFLEWLLSLVKQLRVKVDEGRMWLATFNRRQKKKLGYWKMYKKHGTTFGLSQERTVATQSG